MLKFASSDDGVHVFIWNILSKKIKNKRNTVDILMGYPQCLHKIQKLYLDGLVILCTNFRCNLKSMEENYLHGNNICQARREGINESSTWNL